MATEVLHYPEISQTLRDVTDNKYRDLRRPRKVKFFCNGDRYFKGKQINITPHRFITFNDLLNDLTSKLPMSMQLSYGVRQIYTPIGGHRIRDIDSLRDGRIYVCAGFEGFKKINYESDSNLQPWQAIGKATDHIHEGFYRGGQDYGYARKWPYNGSNKIGAFYPSKTIRTSYQTLATQRASNDTYLGVIKPKIITVVRCLQNELNTTNKDDEPHAKVKILLNRRGVHNLKQLNRDIGEAFGAKYRDKKLERLYNIHGQEVLGVSDLFRGGCNSDDNDIFLGVCATDTISVKEVAKILQELFPRKSDYADEILKEWKKLHKRHKRKSAVPPAATGITNDVPSDAQRSSRRGDVVVTTSTARQKAQDSGLGSDEEFNSRCKPNRRLANDNEQEAILRLERERLKAAEAERERVRRIQQKKQEQEKGLLARSKRRALLGALRPHEIEKERRKQDDKRIREIRKALALRRPQILPLHGSPQKVVVVIRNENDETEVVTDEPRSLANRRSPLPGIATSSPPTSYTTLPQAIAYPKLPQAIARNAGTPTLKLAKSPLPDISVDSVKATTPPAAEPPSGGGGGKHTVVYRTKQQRQVPSADHVLSKYEIGRKLGDGNFAVVKQATMIMNRVDYAMKIMDKAKLKGRDQMVENEIEIMKRCNHANIIKLIEEFETPTELYLIMELVKGGDLFDAITQSVKFSEVDASHMIEDLAKGIHYLHCRNIVHRDIKPENVLVHRNKDNSVTLKLGDFGLAMYVDEPIYTVCGTPTYVAPEILSEIGWQVGHLQGYGLEVDIWALGVISYILLCGFPPFRSADRNQTELFEFIKAGEFEYLTPYWDKISKVAREFINKLLVVERKNRYSAYDTLLHPWLLTFADPRASEADTSTRRDRLKRHLQADRDAGKTEPRLKYVSQT